MILLSNNHKLNYVIASGAMGFDGQGWPWEKPLIWLKFIDTSLFTITLKTITLYPKKGNLTLINPFRCIRIYPRGVLNAVGLSNPGLKKWIEHYASKLNPKHNLISSIQGYSLAEWEKLITKLNPYPIKAFEINVSCPNTRPFSSQEIIEICKVCKETSKHPLILKLTIGQNINEILPNIETFIEAISINSVPWKYVFPALQSPLKNLGNGGLSGKIAQKYNWKFIKEIKKKTNIPVIGGSVWNFQDIKYLKQIIGAEAISFGSLFIHNPSLPTTFVKRLIK